MACIIQYPHQIRGRERSGSSENYATNFQVVVVNIMQAGMLSAVTIFSDYQAMGQILLQIPRCFSNVKLGGSCHWKKLGVAVHEL